MSNEGTIRVFKTIVESEAEKEPEKGLTSMGSINLSDYQTKTEEPKPKEPDKESINLYPVKHSDLRLGNWIHTASDWDRDERGNALPVKFFGEYFKVIQIDADKDVHAISSYDPNNEQCNPAPSCIMAIPLTDELLKRFKFQQDPENLVFWRDSTGRLPSQIELMKSSWSPGSYLVAVNRNYNIMNNDGVKYVHQLQNLFLYLAAKN